MAQSEYEQNRLIRQAVERNFEIIGESLNRLSKVDPDTAARIGEVPRICVGVEPVRKRPAWRPSPAEILRTVRRHFGVRSTAFSEVRRNGNEARVAAIYLVRRLTDQKVTALAEQFGGVGAAAISKMILRAESRKNEDPRWDRLLAKLEKQCTTKRTSKSVTPSRIAAVILRGVFPSKTQDKLREQSARHRSQPSTVHNWSATTRFFAPQTQLRMTGLRHSVKQLSNS